ncbi:MAG: hypothetical protein AAGD38_02675 [Acidobacteriota bacterium]
MELDLDHLLDTAIHAARAGGAELNRLFRARRGAELRFRVDATTERIQRPSRPATRSR